MGSQLHPERPTRGFIDDVIDAFAAIGAALLLLGQIITPWSHTARKTDHSEPPDAVAAIQPFDALCVSVRARLYRHAPA